MTSEKTHGTSNIVCFYQWLRGRFLCSCFEPTYWDCFFQAVIQHYHQRSTLKTGMKVQLVQQVTSWKLLILLLWLINLNNMLCKLNWAEWGALFTCWTLHIELYMYVEEAVLFTVGLCERAHMSSPYSVTFGVVIHGNYRTAMQTWQSCHNVMLGKWEEVENRKEHSSGQLLPCIILLMAAKEALILQEFETWFSDCRLGLETRGLGGARGWCWEGWP